MDGHLWTKIYQTQYNHQAVIVKALLADEDILSIIVNKKDSSYNNFGNCEIFVRLEDLTRAEAVINEQINFQ
jgi:hypothetical protein